MKFLGLNVVITGFVMLSLLINGCNKNTPPGEENAASTSAEVISAIEPATLGTTPNVHIFGDVYFAGQPSETDFAEVKKAGVKTVINLRMPTEVSFDEKQVVSDLGMAYYNLPIGSPNMLTDALIGDLRGLLNQVETHPILLHCGSANRVGATWLAYRIIDGGLSYEDALAEAKIVGLRSKELEDKARDYIERHK